MVLDNSGVNGIARIVLGWDPCLLAVSLVYCSDQLLCVQVTCLASQQVFYVSSVYGSNLMVDRRLLWAAMRSLHLTIGAFSWIQLGDFNVVLRSSERIGEFDLPAASEFRQCLLDTNMEEMITRGFWFTWTNCRGGGGANMSRIDRVLVNNSWLDDLFVLSSAHEGSLQVVLNTLGEFHSFSGLQPNMTRSAVFFSGVSSALKQSLVARSSIPEGTLPEMVAKDYQNFKFQQPYQQAMYYCSLILEDQTWPWNDGLEALPHLQADSLSQFFPLMLSRTFLECYIAGNVEPNEAESMIHYIEDVLFKSPQRISQALFPSQHLTNRVIFIGIIFL
ncbi:hypothetical protein Vadar_032379 [Vaccinium darrowii]|uniref:Uncharacterized protein n=1 Tax=Vaccinium darrowii TaxID=229202 RepID=A0ACB7XVR0_9ERIC|nr:hypothetical protein Vadar_032379 [Vaccinium darrowii]